MSNDFKSVMKVLILFIFFRMILSLKGIKNWLNKSNKN